MLGFDYAIAGFFLVFLIWRRAPVLAYLVPIGVFVITTVLKGLFYLPRPDGVRFDAFPSGHAAFFLTLAFIVYYLKNKKISIIFFVAALIIGGVRVWLGFHYPADVFAGYVLALICAVAYRRSLI